MPNQPKPDNNIALLIDADNAVAAKIKFIISSLATRGIVNIRKAYGNWAKDELKSWAEVLHEYAIAPKQYFDMVRGKNATDMALLIDAMDILYTKQVNTFCLVTSDCDFTPLVLRLREEGKQVIGFGLQKAPKPFVRACTHFVFLDKNDTTKPKHTQSKPNQPQPKQTKPLQTQPTRTPDTTLKKNTKLMNLLRTAVKENTGEDGWASLGQVGSHLSKQGEFNQRDLGYAKLIDLFAAIDLFKVENRKQPGHPRVQLRQNKS
ncbi:NYN domain-containing protein [Novipirellula sp.]|uniref:NYN domain-containing protein n=1 Tax=Novipirellula sp. TaxID=2795430 RepID=UPI003566C639